MDLLVKLYDLPPELPALPLDVTVRRALAPERERVLDWVGAQFGKGWRGEAAAAFAGTPPRILIATLGDEVLGFACYDATAKGLFGPTGVGPEARGLGLGKALLLHTLRAMAADGYAYAVIGGAGPVAFYKQACGAMEIPGSEPGLYRGMLTAR